MAGDTMRLAQRVHRVAVQIGDRLAMDLVGRAAVEFHITRQRHGIVARLGERFADIGRLEFGKHIDLFKYKLTDARKNAAPFDGRHLAPGTVARSLGRLNRAVDVGLAAAGDLAHRFAGRWIFKRQGLAALGRYPFAIDEYHSRVETQPFAQTHGIILILWQPVLRAPSALHRVSASPPTIRGCMRAADSGTHPPSGPVRRPFPIS